MPPDSPVQFQHSGDALMAEQRFTEARAVFDEGLRHFPDNFWLNRSRTLIVRNTAPVDEAIAAAKELLRAFPDEPQAWGDLAEYTRQGLNDNAGAEAIAEAGLARFPDHLWLNHQYVICAEERQDEEEALRRWTNLRTLHPGHTLWVLGIAACLIRLGRLEEAERFLASTLPMFPGDHYTANARALVEQTRANQPVTAKPVAAVAARPTDAEAAIPTPLTHFASLGEDPEFARIQQHFGVEPTSLMSWFDIPPAGTLRLLENGLDGIGDPSQASLIKDRDGNLRVAISRYAILVNTLTAAAGVDQTAFFKARCHALLGLRDRMRDALKSGETIWVYKRNSRVDLPWVKKLHAALRSFGPNRLLSVHLASDKFPKGTVRRLDDGLIVATVSRAGVVRQNGWHSPFEEWHGILDQAARAWPSTITPAA